MSKDSHSFNISVACEVGVSGAIMMQHFLFLQKSNVADGENWQQKWVRRSAKSIAKTYPYWSGKQIASIADNLEKCEYIFSKIENASKIDRTKSYILTAKGLLLMGEIPFAQMENGFSKKGNAIAETENAILPNGEMLIKVDYTSFVPSFVEGENASLFSPSENSFSLEAKKEKKGLQDGAARRNLEPPFSHVATIEPQPPRIVRLNDPDLPGVELIEPSPNPIPNTPNPRSRPVETFARVDISDEITELKSDQLAKETFVMSRKIPVRFFEEYAEAFKADILGRGETYQSRKDFRRHFFSWCGVRYEIDQKKLAKNGASRAHLTTGGANPAVYFEKQKF